MSKEHPLNLWKATTVLLLPLFISTTMALSFTTRKWSQSTPATSQLATTNRPVVGKLSNEEQSRVLTLIKIWAAARQHFSYFDRVPDLDWDRALLEYIPKVQAVTDDMEYYRCLQAFVA